MFRLLNGFRGSLWKYTDTQWNELWNWFQVGGRYTISSYYTPSGYRRSIDLYDYPRVTGFTSTSDAANLLNSFENDIYLETYGGTDIYTHYDFSGPVSEEWTGRKQYKALGFIFESQQAARDYIDSQGAQLIETYRDYYIYRFVDDFSRWNYIVMNDTWGEGQMLYQVQEASGYTEAEALQMCRDKIDSYYEPPPQEYILTISIEGSGSTNPAPGSYTYQEGEQATVQAIPDTGNYFDRWVLNGNESQTNPITLTINTESALTAKFLPNDVPPPPPPPPEDKDVVGPLGLWMFPILNSGQEFGFGVITQSTAFLVKAGILRYE